MPAQYTRPSMQLDVLTEPVPAAFFFCSDGFAAAPFAPVGVLSPGAGNGSVVARGVGVLEPQPYTCEAWFAGISDRQLAAWSC